VRGESGNDGFGTGEAVLGRGEMTVRVDGVLVCEVSGQPGDIITVHKMNLVGLMDVYFVSSGSIQRN